MHRSYAAIKDAVVTALDQLYLQTEDPLAAASNLAGLAAGATVGELGSLEEVVVHLMRGELISHMTIKVVTTHPSVIQHRRHGYTSWFHNLP